MNRIWNKVRLVETILVAIYLLTLLTVAALVLLQSKTEDTGASWQRVSQLSQLHLKTIELSHANTLRDQHLTVALGRQVLEGARKLNTEMQGSPSALPQLNNLGEWLASFERAWRGVARAQQPNPADFNAVRVRADQLIFLLRTSMADAISTLETEVSSERSRAQDLITGITFCVVGGLAAAGVVIWRLLQSLRRASTAEQKLLQHAEMLEATVASRTSELTAAEARLRQAIGSAPDAFFAFDTGGALFAANDLAHNLLPGHASTHLGMQHGRVMMLLQAEMGAQEQDILAASGRYYKVTTRIADDGTMVVRMADLTLERRALQTMQESLAREQRLRRLAKDFVAMVSHQFRTPLALIDSGAQKILRRGSGMAPAELRERAHYIRHAAAGLGHLVDGALDAARIEGGNFVMNPTEVDLRLLLDDLCKQLAELHWDREFVVQLQDLPSSIVCDPLLVDQAVSNLLTNAVKYSSQGSTIRLEGATWTNSISVSVTDHGVGIPQADIERVFEPSYRGSNVAMIDGFGLGLHVSRHIARLHGGDLAVTSGDGVTVFTMRLPFRTESLAS